MKDSTLKKLNIIANIGMFVGYTVSAIGCVMVVKKRIKELRTTSPATK